MIINLIGWLQQSEICDTKNAYTPVPFSDNKYYESTTNQVCNKKKEEAHMSKELGPLSMVY